MWGWAWRGGASIADVAAAVPAAAAACCRRCLLLPAVPAVSDETRLHWFHASNMELDTEFELIGILVGECAESWSIEC
jgi:hypothetical protein